MKTTKLLIFTLFLAISCSEEIKNDVLRPQVEVYRSEFASESEIQTKLGIDSSYKLYWNAEDCISVFTDVQNLKYSFSGQDGDTDGIFSYCSGYLDNTVQKFSNTYAIYPWVESTSAKSGQDEGKFSFVFPSKQYYCPNSFDSKSNVMAAIADGNDKNTLAFKSLCGFLVLKMYGGATIKTVTIKGKSNELISGASTVQFISSDSSSITITGSDENCKSLTLDCGNGVKLSDDDKSPSYFWFSVPPVDFKNGFEIDITTTDGNHIVKSTNSNLAIKRNTITSISPFRVESSFTGFFSFGVKDKSGNVYQAFDISGPDITISVPKGTDLTILTPVFKSNSISVSLDSNTILSGEKSVDFSDYTNARIFTVAGTSGNKTYNIKVIDTSIPVLYVSTPNHAAIADVDNWISSSTIFMESADGSITDLGLTSIKGRGNFSWNYPPKNGYNLKLETKQSIFGLSKNKRWRLMPGWFGITNNSFYLEVGRRCSIGWSPKGDFVELVLNGKWMGLYWLCEHININKDRLNIVEMEPNDLTEPNITGGYILEMDSNYDEDPKFKTPSYQYPVMVSSHDADAPDAQIQWIKNYLGTLESSLKNNSNLSSGVFQNYIDIDNFCDYLFIMEIVEKWDFRLPRSVYMHKDRNGKLRMGPLWDMDYKFTRKNVTGGLSDYYHQFGSSTTSDDNGWFFTHALYYNELMKSNLFKSSLSKRWPEFKACITGMTSYIDELASKIEYSAERDYLLWKNVPLKQNPPTGAGWPSANRSFSSFSEEIANIKDTYEYNINWIDSNLSNLIGK